MKSKFQKAILMFLAVMLSATGIAQNNITITGTVFDETGESLPGVNIIIKGQDKGTITDFDGKFGITVANTNAILVFSYL